MRTPTTLASLTKLVIALLKWYKEPLSYATAGQYIFFALQIPGICTPPPSEDHNETTLGIFNTHHLKEFLELWLHITPDPSCRDARFTTGFVNAALSQYKSAEPTKIYLFKNADDCLRAIEKGIIQAIQTARVQFDLGGHERSMSVRALELLLQQQQQQHNVQAPAGANWVPVSCLPLLTPTTAYGSSDMMSTPTYRSSGPMPNYNYGSSGGARLAPSPSISDLIGIFDSDDSFIGGGSSSCGQQGDGDDSLIDNQMIHMLQSSYPQSPGAHEVGRVRSSESGAAAAQVATPPIQDDSQVAALQKLVHKLDSRLEAANTDIRLLLQLLEQQG